MPHDDAAAAGGGGGGGDIVGGRPRRPTLPGDFQLNEDYDNNFYVFVGLLHRLRAKYEYVKKGYERKNLPPGRSLKHLVSIIESFIDLASNSIAAPPQYEGRVQPSDVPVPEGARTDHVMRRRMVVIEDAGQLFALDPGLVIGGEICMCGKARRPAKPLPHQQQAQQQQQQPACEHCLFEKTSLLRIARELSQVANKGLRDHQQQQQQQQSQKVDRSENDSSLLSGE